MAIRLIALDLDGTLLDSEKHISERNCRALEQAHRAGIQIVPSTGRFFRGVPGEYLLDNVVGNERLGYWGIVVARRLFDGEEMAIDQYLPTYKVMGDDMMKFVEDNGLTEINGVAYETVSIDEARQIVASDSYRAEFDADFVPTK